MTLKDVKHWVFDMDGTMTVAVHDFAAIRRALDIPAQDDILTHLNMRCLIHEHQAHDNSATMVVRKHSVQIAYGVVENDGKGNLTGIKEKPVFNVHFGT